MHEIRMSTNSDDHTLVKQNDYQEVEVDYADPESPTQRDPLSPVKSAVVDIDGIAGDVTDDTGPQPGLQTQITAPTPASHDNEVELIAIRSTAEPRTTRRRSSRGSNDSAGEDIESAQPDNLKRRRLDLGELMIKPAVPAKPSLSSYSDRRPEIMRLAETSG